FCDWYIEFSKLFLYGEDEEAKRVTRAVLCHVLDRSLRLLHPFMPFITEEIWQKLPGTGPSISVAEWPVADESLQAPDAVKEMRILIDVIRSVRNIRSEMEIPPKRKITLLIRTEPEVHAAIRDNESAICRLCGAEKVTAGPDVTRPDKAMTAVVSGAEVFLPLEGMIDIEETIARLEKELKKLDYEVERVEKKLSNPGFVQKAPAHIVEGERRKGEEYREKREKVLARLRELKG